MTTNNPLSQFFRQPAIYLRLPSQGKYWAANSLDMPPNQELPVYPMTARDEITYRTPDALFNGSALISVIQSCVPNIKNAWEIPNCDFDTVLVSIRIASYGHKMDVDTKCPKCSTETNYALDLRMILDGLSMPDFDRPLHLGDLEINFKPITFKISNQSNIVNFENQKRLQAAEQENIAEDKKAKIYSEILKKITDSTFQAIAFSIASIKTPDAVVTNTEYITDFLNNCDRKIYDKIKDTAIELKSKNELKPLNIKCNNCQHQYQQAFTLDMTNFFGDAS